jgi:hypothetical protein
VHLEDLDYRRGRLYWFQSGVSAGGAGYTRQGGKESDEDCQDYSWLFEFMVLEGEMGGNST